MKRLLIFLFLIFVSFSFTKARSADHKMQGSQSKSHNNGDLEGKASAKQTSVERHGYLSVQNGKMVDQHGFQPQLRGISFSWSIWEGEKYYNKEVVDWLVDDFKVDLIRLSMAIEPDGGYLQSPKKQEEKIISLIDQGIERGVYVIIDWHDHNANKNQTESAAFFQEMSKRYQHVPNVIYEIWNEPERQTWPEIKAYSEKIISAIRTYDKRNLIVVGSPHWDQDVDVTAKDPINLSDNLVYSFHFYASDPGHQEKLREKAEIAIGLGLPLFITEWGVGESNGDGEFNLEKTDRWVRWMEKHKLSWVNWNITDKEETTALLKPGAPVNGGWNTSNLTPAGDYIRTVLRNFDANK
ncbi:glycoside hydrolase family 5 protein [Albibacterium bauzanense]|uniref:Endoglucanase n=1 Tax=Albibacterium bauzanense TaxID=653929 RepID=A0A4R1M7N1_9SPHI|nr:glycoside hydrolase family 5 protein [Albibacterium bauzanense]TCK85849.1 endoglucanase [Albibacterium bauzanense]